MKRTNICLFILSVLILAVFHHPVHASSNQLLDKPGVMQLLQETYDTQYSLTERYHTWDEAKEKLTQYVTEELAEDFMVEHLFEEEEGYIFYGTDFSAYIIPEYSYTDSTKIVITSNQDTIFVYEKSSSVGPVTFSPQYEIVTISYIEKQWKVSDISFEEELPEEVLQSNDLDEVKGTAKVNGKKATVKVQPNVERVNYIATGSIAKFTIDQDTILPSLQPYASLVPYQLLFQNVKNRPSLLTFSTIFTVKGEVR
ncbi:DUF3993 domain-containing protein [Bacillus pinisoli]|uniref:DUF3993 domain-containing protein n=1 Tax=Bacillus pinisoli TaxID=2901866 RepID=UPI001FF215AF